MLDKLPLLCYPVNSREYRLVRLARESAVGMPQNSSSKGSWKERNVCLRLRKSERVSNAAKAIKTHTAILKSKVLVIASCAAIELICCRTA